MKRRRWWIGVGFAAALVCLAAPCWGAADWQTRQTFAMEQKALDVAISPDGLWVYVLTGDGELLVYTRDGVEKNRLEVGAGASAIAVGPEEGVVYLVGGAAGEVSVLEVALRHTFDFERSPAKGPAAAPVTIAVFSDFQ
jgi:6-phosphogluconolactonase (cycloisomerase 2 family)